MTPSKNSPIPPSKLRRKAPFFKILLILVLVAGAYLWGMVTGYRHLYPLKELFFLENRFISSGSILSGTVLMRYAARSKPRNTLFETFSPPAEVVMIGDSLTADAPWNEMFPQVRIANRGIGGDRTIDILQRMDPIFAVNPQKAFLSVGLNDLAFGVGVDQVFVNYVQIVQQLQKRGITVYIQSTIECSRASCGTQLDQVRRLNTKLKGYAQEHHIVYIDLNQNLSSKEGGLLPEYTYDGSHLLGKAYSVWSKAIGPYMLPTK
jgi:lysophospholipase L1-like esterase